MKEWTKGRSNTFKINYSGIFQVCCLVLVLIFVFNNDTTAQNSRKALEDKRKRLLKDIEQTTSLLNQTKQNRESAYSNFVTLQRQIGKRQQLIMTLQSEVVYLNTSIDRSNGVVETLNNDIDRLKQDYSVMARNAYRQSLSHTDWLFLLSARSFNEAFQRWQYLKQYDKYRQKQANLILETQRTLISKINTLEQRRAEKQHLLDSEQRHEEMLNLELSAKDRLLDDLKNDEKNLTKDLMTKKIAEANLAEAIEKIIKEEIEKARRDVNRVVADRPTRPNSPGASEASNISREFQNNRGRLPWPVANGVVTGTFGKQQHPVFKNIQITNNGIDIRTDVGSKVKSVFNGEVVGTQYIPGYDYMIILKHGDYYSVYSNLEGVNVKKGDPVKINQEIGKVSTNWDTHTSELHFEIWKDKTRLNPSEWVVNQ